MRKSTAQKDLAGHTKQLHGPNVAHGPRVGQPWFNGYENNYLLVIHCLKYFFCEQLCEKKFASPAKSLTARHWQLHTSRLFAYVSNVLLRFSAAPCVSFERLAPRSKNTRS